MWRWRSSSLSGCAKSRKLTEKMPIRGSKARGSKPGSGSATKECCWRRVMARPSGSVPAQSPAGIVRDVGEGGLHLGVAGKGARAVRGDEAPVPVQPHRAVSRAADRPAHVEGIAEEEVGRVHQVPLRPPSVSIGKEAMTEVGKDSSTDRCSASSPPSARKAVFWRTSSTRGPTALEADHRLGAHLPAVEQRPGHAEPGGERVQVEEVLVQTAPP
jgi:hypothetical protein